MTSLAHKERMLKHLEGTMFVSVYDEKYWAGLGDLVRAFERAYSARQNKQLIEALAPFANLAHEHDFNQMPDDAVIEVPVPVRHLKKAWIVFAKVAGETQ